ncbi:MAG TPA: dTMP kinase [Thermodesulfobacteriota bacterium]|nr:dTMP kinase [Thermodesulfobacteriota bacterium]
MLITFEGIEGSGKSTQANLLNEFLSGKGYKVTLTREPGWGHLGNLIRTRILEERELVLAPMAELFLFCADRAQHVKDFIAPRLKNGEIVICDRFYDSTVVYQGYGRKLDMRLVNKAAKASALDVAPAITFLLNLPVREGLARLKERGSITKMDEEPIEFHEMIRQGYMLIARREPERIKSVNAARDITTVHEEIRALVMERLTSQ